MLKTASLHWLWIKLLAACSTRAMAAIPLYLLGITRWMIFGKRRRRISEYYAELQKVAMAAGCTGVLTNTRPSKLARRYFLHRATLGAAPALASSASNSFVESFFVCNKLPTVAAAADTPSSLLIVGSHFGSMGITPALLARNGHRVVILRDQQFQPLVTTRHSRQFFLGAEPVFVDTANPGSVNTALMRCARAMRDGAVVAYTADAAHGTRYFTGEIFGRPVQLRTALIELAIRNQCPVTAGFSYTKNGRIQVELSTPSLLSNVADLQQWCREFCLRWQTYLLDYPEAIAWHRTDLQLIDRFTSDSH